MWRPARGAEDGDIGPAIDSASDFRLRRVKRRIFSREFQDERCAGCDSEGSCRAATVDVGTSPRQSWRSPGAHAELPHVECFESRWTLDEALPPSGQCKRRSTWTVHVYRQNWVVLQCESGVGVGRVESYLKQASADGGEHENA